MVVAVRYEGLAFTFFNMSTDQFLKSYRQKAYRNKNKLTAFLTAVVKQGDKSIYPLVRKAEKFAWTKVDCTKCGNCCKTMTPTWKKPEVKKLAAHLGMTYQEFFDKWLYVEESTGDICNNSTPCQFLDGQSGLCTVYELRPHDCAKFPHLHRKDFFDQAELYAANLHRCPATYEAMKHLYDLANQKG